MPRLLGDDIAERVKDLSLQIYSAGRDHAAKHGIIVADTKFEFGTLGDQLLLIDECLTPDSSRFWPADNTPSARAHRVSINNLCAIIWRHSIGTKRRRRHDCHRIDRKNFRKIPRGLPQPHRRRDQVLNGLPIPSLGNGR